jgi:hypothetical protein
MSSSKLPHPDPLSECTLVEGNEARHEEVEICGYRKKVVLMDKCSQKDGFFGCPEEIRIRGHEGRSDN